ncbi:MAG: SH3 domain-containing protein [Saprospiraceae bacterium]|nr:SH3 domain-containing protein [Saprospiraceae bacterium]
MCLLVFAGCEQFTGGHRSEGNQITQDTIQQKPQLTSMTILLTNVDQLRLRRYPDLRSEMLTTFDENTPLYFTGEQTDYEETIGGRKGAWKRVKTTDGELEGWVFGADYFVSEWLDRSTLDSIHDSGRDIRIVANLSRSEMKQLTGANFASSQRGTRYSGYYEYSMSDDPQLLDGRLMVRARQFDTDSKDVIYKKCTLLFDQGMPESDLDCQALSRVK